LLDQKASFSVFMDALGVDMFSAYPDSFCGVVCGTLLSAPVIAGTAAPVRSLQRPGVSQALQAEAVNVDSRNPQYAQQLGYGRIDVRLAVGP
jgi:hypothetical protein